MEMVRTIRDQMYLENKNKTDAEKIEFISDTAKEFESKNKKRKTEKRLKAA